MPNVLVNSASLTAIASAIRSKLGVQTQYKPGQMADAIESISGGGITPTGTKSITVNGTYDVSSFANAEVNVPTGGDTPTGTKNITENGVYDVSSFASVNVEVQSGGNSASGTFVGDGTTKAISLPIGFEPSHVCVYVSEANIGTDTVWSTMNLMYNAGDDTYQFGQRYGATNYSGNRKSMDNATYANGTMSFVTVYPCRSGVTYNWFAW